jgi:inner membrane protein
MIWEIWWAWVAAGIGLAILEVIVPGFVFLGFAIGAVVVGALVAVGLVLALAWALVVFAIVSVVAWVLLRQVFGIRRGQRKTFRRDINED